MQTVLKIINMTTNDTSDTMTLHNFADLFKQILFPLFVEDDRKKFCTKTVKEDAMNDFVRKFEDDH